MLLPIAGKPLVLHTAERAGNARNVSRVIVATDDSRIFEAAAAAGCEVMRTSSGHLSGSDRVAEIAAGLETGTVVVNVQGDEPLISPRTIESAVDALLEDDECDIATTFEDIERVEDVTDPNIVKVVSDVRGRALYFSRAPIPFPRGAATLHGSLSAALAADASLLSTFKKHTGLYVYRREFLLEFTNMKPTRLEMLEMLEQLRALENGAVIKVVKASSPSIGVDTAEDLERVRAIFGTGMDAGSAIV